MFCKYCGKELSDNAKFCSKCGKQIVRKEILKTADSSESEQSEKSDENEAEKALKFCKYCGQRISAIAKFCPKCGKNIVSKSAQKSEEQKANETIAEKELVQATVTTQQIIGAVGESGKSQQVTEPIAKAEPVEQIQYITEAVAKTESLAKEEQIAKPEEISYSDEKQAVNNLTYSYYEKFTAKNLFVQVFRKHTAKERDGILKAGLISDEELNNVKISPEKLQPWFYSRVFLILFAVFVVFEICLLNFYNMNILPGVMLIGSVMIPFSLLTMYFELNVYKDISFYKVIGIFLLGGAVSLLFTLVLYAIIPTTDDFNFFGASLVSMIEEVGKFFVVIVLLNRIKNATVLHGLLIGGAIGCGFAAFESAGYAFRTYLAVHDYNTRIGIANSVLPWYYQYGYADSITEMNFNIFMRSILSFGGHTAWAAITGAAFAKAKKINLDFMKSFAICFILHALWDTDTPAVYFRLICLCLVAWWVIIRQVANFVEENKQKFMEDE